jgi:hypothetical protein
MISGVSCANEARIVTLKFTVKEVLVNDITTSLSLPSVIVNPPANYIGATVAPAQPVSVELQSGSGPAGIAEIVEVAEL